MPVKITLAYMSKLLRDERPDYFIKVVIVGDKVPFIRLPSTVLVMFDTVVYFVEVRKDLSLPGAV